MLFSFAYFVYSWKALPLTKTLERWEQCYTWA